jgi:ketol-acid reductoisomerase
MHDLTVYHVLKYNVLVMTREAVARLQDLLSNPSHRNKLPKKRRWWANEKKVFQEALQEIMDADVKVLETPSRLITR